MVCPPGDNDNEDLGEKTAVLQGDPETLKKELQKAKEQEACLIIIRGTPQGHRFFLTQDEMTVGRDPSADISVADISISRKHARLTKVKGKIQLTDLGSQNGTWINDSKLGQNQSTLLTKEDMIKMGNSIFKFLPAGEIEAMWMGHIFDAANQDGLTRIYNKAYLLEALEAEFKRAKALHSDFAILFFDLDHFKKINDNFGHDAGDYVLKELTSIVRSGFVRPKDVFARYGGEEFVLLLANSNMKKAADIAEKIRASVESHAFIYEGKRLPVTTSIGVAEITTQMESSQTLIRSADRALYAAKSGGRNRVVTAS